MAQEQPTSQPWDRAWKLPVGFITALTYEIRSDYGVGFSRTLLYLPFSFSHTLCPVGQLVVGSTAPRPWLKLDSGAEEREPALLSLFRLRWIRKASVLPSPTTQLHHITERREKVTITRYPVPQQVTYPSHRTRVTMSERIEFSHTPHIT